MVEQELDTDVALALRYWRSNRAVVEAKASHRVTQEQRARHRARLAVAFPHISFDAYLPEGGPSYRIGLRPFHAARAIEVKDEILAVIHTLPAEPIDGIGFGRRIRLVVDRSAARADWPFELVGPPVAKYTEEWMVGRVTPRGFVRCDQWALASLLVAVNLCFRVLWYGTDMVD